MFLVMLKMRSTCFQGLMGTQDELWGEKGNVNGRVCLHSKLLGVPFKFKYVSWSFFLLRFLPSDG